MSVVVGYKDTPLGEAALTRGIEEARIRAVPLHVLWSIAATAPGDAASTRAAIGRQEAALGRLGAIAERARAAGVEAVETHLVLESRGESQFLSEMLQLVDRTGAELLVIGLRNRSPVGKLLLGSRAQDLLLNVGCDVLAVKARTAR